MTSKTQSTMSSMANNPNLPFQISTHSLISQALRNHLRSTGLLGECSDIRLKTFGRIYSLHRLLLIQSAFFNSMLLSGFKEGLDLDDAAAKRNKTKRKARAASQRRKSQGHLQSEDDIKVDDQEDDDDDDVIELHFDDPQITRAAFEYAIAHLYGAAPELVLPIWASPSAEEPLSPVFGLPTTSSTSMNRNPSTSSDEDQSSSNDQQPATPRFLCSLIATSIYLGLPALTSQALTLILCSITPYTVKHYLHFAIGRGIAGASQVRIRQLETEAGIESNNGGLWDWELEGPIRGLESFGKRDSSGSTQIDRLYSNTSDREEETEVSSGSDHGRTGSTTPSAIVNQSLDSTMDDASRKRGRGEAAFSSPSKPTSESATKKNRYREPSHFGESSRAVYLYGSIGEKIGEACACWLARWGTEVLEVEESTTRGQDGQLLPISDRHGHFFYDKDDLPSFSSVMATPPPLSVWSRGSIPSAWVRAIISSDSFFVPDEWERYVFATRVVDLRRSQKGQGDGGEPTVQARGEEEGYESIESDGEDHSPVGRRFNNGFGNSSLHSNKKSAGASSRKQKERISIKVNEAGSINRRSRFEMDQDEAEVDDGDFSDSDSEEEYSQLFREGIYYTHMDFNRLEQISGLGYAPQNVLHSALWRNSALQNSIKASEVAALKASGTTSPTSNPENNEPTEAEISASSLSQSLSLLDFVKAQEASRSRAGSPFVGGRSGTPLSGFGSLNLGNNSSSNPTPDLSRRYYPVPVDDTIRLGDSLASLSNNASTSIEEDSGESSATGVAALVDPNTLSLPPPLNNRQIHDSPIVGGPLIETSVKGFFGLDNWVRNGHEIALRAAKVAEQPIEDSMDETLSSVQGEYEVEKQSSDEVEDSNGVESEEAEERDEGDQEPTSADLEEDVDEEEEEARDEEGQEGEGQDQPMPPQHNATASSVPSYLRTSERSSGTPPPGQPPTPSKKKGTPSSPPPSSSTSPLLTQEHWSGFEPMRVSFEFFGVDKLQEKQRLYSPTFHFAGSLWNVYVQTLKKPKGLQLGVYLHRQNPLDSLPPYSIPSPPPSTNELAASDVGSRKTATVIASSSGVPTSSTGASVFYPSSPSAMTGLPLGFNPITSPNDQSSTSNDQVAGYRSYSLLSGPSTSTSNSQPNLQPAEMPQMPYHDSRRMLKASFSINCPSPLGTALTRFSSAPDQFTLSQSWGWKSSSLLGSTYLKDGVLGSVKTEGSGRFRCSCVIGLV